VVGPVDLPVLQLGLRHRGAERGVPQRRGLCRVGLAPSQVAQERPLRRGPRDRADRRVLVGPVVGQAQPPPESLVRALVLGRLTGAEFDEVAPVHRDGAFRVGRGRWLERRVERQRWIAAHAVQVLHPPLGGQAVVVPADGEEDRLAAHALVPGDQIGVGEGEDVSNVEGSGYRGRRGVDRVDVRAVVGPVERVRSLLLPLARPALLEPVQGRGLGHASLMHGVRHVRTIRPRFWTDDPVSGIGPSR
jgi:hypothetical protein